MKTCLVVDDSSVVRKVAARILEELDFQIVEAADADDYAMKPFDKDIVAAKFQEVGSIQVTFPAST